MLVHEEYALDPDGACRLIAAHGWATIVTAGPTGIRATYGFCLLEPEDGQGITVLGHIARADPQAADLIAGASTLLIFNGPHGYVSASWYRPTMTQVPSTWNYTAVHLRGTPVMLTGTRPSRCFAGPWTVTRPCCRRVNVGPCTDPPSTSPARSRPERRCFGSRAKILKPRPR
jgi:predicted FMN-binding regulatory protein PaiB